MEAVLQWKKDAPYYWQIMEHLQRQIREGHWQPDEMLPSAIELSRYYHVNRHTVRQAVDELCRRGWVYKVRGRGAFVAGQAPQRVTYAVSAAPQLAAGVPGGCRILLGYKRQGLEEAAAERLALRPGTAVYSLELLQLREGQPIASEQWLIPEERLGNLPLLLEKKGIDEIVAAHYGANLRRRYAAVAAALPNADEAQRLEIAPHLPVLKLESVVVSEDNQPILICQAVYRSDLAALRIDWGQAVF